MKMELESKYAKTKVYNEIELCELQDISCKDPMEKQLLKNRISYFIRWTKPRLLGPKEEKCIFCVNDWQKEQAEQVIREMDDFDEKRIKFVRRRIDKVYY
ncbi:MAG: hypothetical protein PHP50_13740 [Lachnospiraceae bacterium]|nr:hypothetical protein [Lachnospiraceae bacterium]